MTAPEAKLGFRADEQHAALAVGVSLLDEVACDRLRRHREFGNGEPVLPDFVAYLFLLQAEREQLLGDDVPRLRRRDDGLDETSAPGEEQPGRMKQFLFIDCEERQFR